MCGQSMSFKSLLEPRKECFSQRRAETNEGRASQHAINIISTPIISQARLNSFAIKNVDDDESKAKQSQAKKKPFKPFFVEKLPVDENANDTRDKMKDFRAFCR